MFTSLTSDDIGTGVLLWDTLNRDNGGEWWGAENRCLAPAI